MGLRRQCRAAGHTVRSALTSSSAAVAPLLLQQLLLAMLLLPPLLGGGERSGGGGGHAGPAGAMAQGVGSDAPREGGGGGGTVWGVTLSEQTGQYLSDPSKWKWPADNAPGAEKVVYNTLIKWCGSTYAEAVRDAGEKWRTFNRLIAERDQRLNEWMRCGQERAAREMELESECEKAKELQQSEFERERTVLRVECHAETELLSAELEACELKLKKKIEAVCDRDKELERASCAHAKRGLTANLTACQQKGLSSNSTRVAELEALAAEFEADGRAWREEESRLVADLAECRPARAHAEARLHEVLADGTIDTLERTVLWLQVAVALSVVLLLTAIGFNIWLALNHDRPTGSGSYGWVAAQPANRMRLVTADVAKEMLERAYEGRTRSRLPVVLTTVATTPENENATPVIFLLVPVNVSSSRRFSLFNSGGDYVPHVEKAQEIVAKAFQRFRLVVVLYEGNGSLFAEKTLHSLRLNPDKVAYEAVPKDSDFPKSHNLVVPWVDKAEGVRVTDSERESDLTSTIKAQPWAQYLLSRSGHWGEAHAQLS